MELDRKLLNEATEQGLLSPAQADRLWHFLAQRTADRPAFRMTHILYYLGGLIAIGAMTLFMTLGWERFGAWGLLGIALLYAILGLALTRYFLKRRQAIPAGITATFVVALTPLAVYALQAGLGFWAEGMVYRDYHRLIDWRWLFMELATLAAAVLLLWRYRLPFLVMPLAVTLWYLSMDLTPFLFGDADRDWTLRKQVSLWFGLLMALLAVLVDIRTRRGPDFAFWLYLLGVLTFWCGLSLLQSDSELGKFLYCCVNLLMIGLGAMLARRVFVLFGGLGLAGYLAYLAHEVFRDSLLFPFALTALGLALIWCGLLWQRHEARLGARLRGLLPQPLRELIEQRQ